MPDAFISYSRRNIAFARLLMEAFEKNDIRAWIDWQDIPPSADWLAEVYEAIEQSDAFIFVISEHSVVSEICSMEIAHAAKNNKRLIPIVVNEVEPTEVPAPLAALQWIFFNQEDRFGDAVQDLIDAIQTDQDWVKAHTRLQNRSLEWSRKDRPQASLLRGQDLAQAETWLSLAGGKDLAPTALQTEFIFTSRKEAARRQRMGSIAAGVGIVVTLFLGMWAWTQRAEAVQTTQARATAESQAIQEARTRATAQADAITEEHARATAQAVLESQYLIASSRRLAAQASKFRGDQLDLGLLLSLEAFGMQDNRETRRNLLDAIADQPHLERFLFTDPRLIFHVYDFDHQGNLVLYNQVDQEIQIRENESGALLKQVRSPHEIANLQYLEIQAPQPGIRFSLDGALMLTGGMDKSWILWDATTYQPLGAPLTDKPVWKTIISFSPTFDRLATLDQEAISIWDRESGKLLLRLEDLPGGVKGVPVFTRDSAHFIAAFEGRMIREYEVDSGTLVHQFEPDPAFGSIQTLEVNAQGTRLGVIGTDRISLYDLTGGEEVTTYKRKANVLYQLFFDPQGQAYLLYDDDHRDLYLERLGEENFLLSRFHHFEDTLGITAIYRIDPASLHITALRTYMVSAELVTYDPLIPFPILESIPFKQRMEGHQRLTLTAFHPSRENILATGACGDRLAGSTCELSLWDLSEGAPDSLKAIEVRWPIRALGFNPEGDLLAFAGGDGSIGLWDWEQDEQTLLVEGLDDHVEELAFDGDGKYLAARFEAEDSPVVVWDVDTGESFARIQADSGEATGVEDIAFHPEQPWLAIAYGDRALLWDLEQQTETAEFSLDEPWRIFELLAFQPDGTEITTGGKDGFARWDLETWQPISLPMEENSTSYYIERLAYDPTGTWLVTGSVSTVSLYDAAGGEEIGELNPQGINTLQDQYNFPLLPTLAFSPSGSRMTAYAREDELLFWRLDLESWQAAACQIANRNLTPQEWTTYIGDSPYGQTCP